MRWNLVLERYTQNRLNQDTTRKKLLRMASGINSNRSMGCAVRVGKLPEPERVFDAAAQQEKYRYQVQVEVVKRRDDGASLDFVEDYVRRNVGASQWSVASKETQDGAGRQKGVRSPFSVPMLTESAKKRFFSGIYERDAHMRIIHDTTHEFVRSGRVTRSHVLLYGKPGSCKTTLLERFQKFYEQGGAGRVEFIDGPTLSKAGLENWLIDRVENGSLPDVIGIEEIEKQNMDNILMLLSVMASGVVAKTNARIGRFREKASVIVWATCNDARRVKEFEGGSVWSRFCHKLYCPSPSKRLMEKILHEEIIRRGGNPQWVAPVMKFAYEDIPAVLNSPIEDPREIIGLLDGGDRLLDGTYQRDKLEIMEIEISESTSRN